MRLLVIEDSPTDVELLHERLRHVVTSSGVPLADIYVAENFEQGLRLARELDPDCVLIDIGLPNGGVERLPELIRALEPWPTVVWSGLSDVPTLCDALGPTPLASKDAGAGTLLSSVHLAMRARTQQVSEKLRQSISDLEDALRILDENGH